jgi:hypothetical protein
MRAQELVHAVARELTLTGCPAPKVVLIEGTTSHFLPDVWLIELATPAVELNNPTTEQFAEICDHVRHEWEHAVLEFRVARRENQQTGAGIDALAERLHIDRGAAEMAIRANAAGGYFEAVDAAPLDAQTAAIRESLHGAGQLDRNLILDRLRAAETALAAARANEDPAGQAAIADALLEYNAAHADYLTLPDEIAAWDVGRQVAEVVRLHHDLATRIVTARKQLGRAETALERGGAGRALERLESAVTRAQNHLNDLLDILADRTGRNP